MSNRNERFLTYVSNKVPLSIRADEGRLSKAGVRIITCNAS